MSASVKRCGGTSDCLASLVFGAVLPSRSFRYDGRASRSTVGIIRAEIGLVGSEFDPADSSSLNTSKAPLVPQRDQMNSQRVKL